MTKREQVLQTTLELITELGFHATPMALIIEKSGVAAGTIYYYFKSKEELFNEVLKQEVGAVKAELSKIVNSDKDSLITLKDYMLTRLKLLHKAVNYHETLKADFFDRYHFVKDVRDDFTEFERTQLTIILKKGKKEGYLDVKNINSAVNIIMMVVNGIEIPLFLQNKYYEYEPTIDELATMIVHSLKTQKR